MFVFFVLLSSIIVQCLGDTTLECGYNEVPSNCKQTCPPQSCDFSYDKYACKPGPCQPGCNCIGNYLRNSSGICVPKDQCDSEIECGYNEVPSNCKQTCPPQSCDFSYDKYACKPGPCQPGCNCIGNYLRNSSGICVPKDQCDTDSPILTKCGLNEMFVKCKTTCPPQACNLAYTEYLCDPNPNPKCEPGCDCIKDYLRDDEGNCIYNEDCPYPTPLAICGEFEEPIISDSGKGEINPDENCKCIDNYIRDSNRTCVPVDQEPALECGYNEVPSNCKQTCPPQSCDFSYDKYACKPGPCQPGCNCIGNYLRNSSGICVPKDQCDTDSSVPMKCGLNEMFVKCKTTCPPQACNLAYTEYLCDPNPNPKCEPGCDCIKDYLRDDEGNCIYNEDCPYPTPPAICGEFEEPITCDIDKDEINSDENCKCIDNYIRDSNGTCVPVDQEPTLECGYNEVPSNCKQTCPPQSCDFSYDKYACKPGPCQPGCNCIGNYLRNSSGICVPKDQCDTVSDEDCQPIIASAKASASSSSSSSSSSAHASASSSFKNDCVNAPNNSTGGTPCIYDQCTPTCSIPNPSNCPQTSNPCNCASGYILSEKGGQCVKLEECKKYLNCNGDRNATFEECPRSCKSSCKNPNGFCNGECDSSGCQCNPLYLLSDEGKCILPDDCPGGNPCPQNETFIYCNVGCPTNYCPRDDNRAIIACSPPYPCPSGCACKANYKRLSSEDNRCILASDCPPVNCTRENEEWNSCPPPCFTESCQDLNKPPRECYRSGLDCQPQCVCKEGYCRNDTDICVPISNC